MVWIIHHDTDFAQLRQRLHAIPWSAQAQDLTSQPYPTTGPPPPLSSPSPLFFPWRQPVPPSCPPAHSCGERGARSGSGENVPIVEKKSKILGEKIIPHTLVHQAHHCQQGCSWPLLPKVLHGGPATAHSLPGCQQASRTRVERGADRRARAGKETARESGWRFTGTRSGKGERRE